jgi:glucose uptake protein GlcU
MSGYLAGALSAVFNGSFAAPFKFENVAAVDLHPIYFQLYVAVGVFITCFLFQVLLPLNDTITANPNAEKEFIFVTLGFPCGVLFLMSVLFSFLAIPRIGLALGQGVWGGCAIVTSFFLGCYKNNSLGNIPLALLALVLLLVGVMGITFCEAIGERLSPQDEDSSGSSYLEVEDDAPASHVRPTSKDSGRSSSFVGRSSSFVAEGLAKINPEKESDANKSDTITGLWCALMVGLAGGSTLFPAQYAPIDQQGITLLPAFGFGGLVTALTTLAGFGAYVGFDNMPPMHLKETLVTGLLSGALWNMSNVLAIYAIPRIGIGVAYPVLQCALFVAGLWGIFVFKEIRGAAAIKTFFVSGTILIGGAATLALSQQ